MRLPINVEELLSGRAVESDRLEYKQGWNPDAIYRTICAFANDFDETGGGYIVIGVKEENGHALRPVLGINPNLIESIEKDMVGYNNLIRPYYQPRLFIEEADGKTILVIKVTPGERRPYKVPDLITAKQKTFNYYIRYNSSSIIPKGEYEHELINLANRIPFDDRGNDNISLKDISPLLLHDYLVKVKSSLSDISLADNMENSNGSPLATIETDDERSFFLIDIPCHPQFVKEQVITNRDFVKDFAKGNFGKLSERQIEILQMIAEDGTLTSQKISQKIGVAQRTIQMDLAKLQTKGLLIREGGRKEGIWVIIADK